MYFIRANYDNDDDEKFSSPKFGHRTKLQTVIFDTVDVRGVPKNLEVGVPSPLVAGHNRPKSISLSQMCYCARWVSVPEGVNFKLCVLVYRSLHGLGPKYFFQRTSGSCPRFTLARDCVQPRVPTSWFLSHAGLHLATAHFRSQELGHGTRYRPVSPPRRLCSFRRLLKTFLFQRQLRL